MYENSSKSTILQSSSSSSHDFELSLNDLFKHLSVNMTFSSRDTNDKECEVNPLLWAQKWEIQFEQREPPMLIRLFI